MVSAVGVMVTAGWGVGLGRMIGGVAEGKTDAVVVGVVECSRPISNVPLQAVITRRKRTVGNMKNFMGPPDLSWISSLF
jgi:hypothetical protein